MLLRASVAIAVLASASLASCTARFINPEDRTEACRVAVEEKFGAPVFEPNSLSGGGGTFAGAGKGALAGLGSGQASLLLAPIGLLIGAGVGTACAIAGAQHPNADADFAKLLHQADAGLVKRTLEARLREPRTECATNDGIREALPDAVVAIEKIEAGMGCLIGKQDFWIAVTWRTVTKSGRVLNVSVSKREYTSAYDVDDWFTHPERARGEIEVVLGLVVHSMATQFVGDDALREQTAAK